MNNQSNLLPFDQCVEVASRIKGLKKSEYKATGKYPVIDQGQNFVTAYSDRQDLVESNTPFIVFGDHTRIIKYIESPVILGNDGIKVLRSKGSLNEKYLYYNLLSFKIPNTGYNRHFKFLVENKLSVPPSATQQKIATILTSVDNAIVKTDQIIQKTEVLKNGIIQKTFNSRDWKTSPLGDVLDLVIDHRGLTPKKLGGDWSANGTPALSAMNVKNGKIVNHDQIRFVDETLYKRWMPKEIQEGDTLLTSEAPLGEAYLAKENDKYCLSQRLFALRPNASKITSDFLYYFITSTLGKKLLEDRSTGSTAKGIRQSELVKVMIKYPELSEQNHIGFMLSTIDQKIDFYKNELKTLQSLKRGFMQDIFSQKIQIN